MEKRHWFQIGGAIIGTLMFGPGDGTVGGALIADRLHQALTGEKDADNDNADNDYDHRNAV